MVMRVVRSKNEILDRIQFRKEQQPILKEKLSKALEVTFCVFGPLKKMLLWGIEPKTNRIAGLPIKQLETCISHHGAFGNEEIRELITYFEKEKKEQLTKSNFLDKDEEGNFSLSFLGDSKSKVKSFLKKNGVAKKAIQKGLKKAEKSPIVFAQVESYKYQISLIYETVLEDYQWMLNDR